MWVRGVGSGLGLHSHSWPCGRALDREYAAYLILFIGCKALCELEAVLTPVDR